MRSKHSHNHMLHHNRSKKHAKRRRNEIRGGTFKELLNF
jgi:hypothetical protein